MPETNRDRLIEFYIRYVGSYSLVKWRLKGYRDGPLFDRLAMDMCVALRPWFGDMDYEKFRQALYYRMSQEVHDGRDGD